MKKTFGIAFAVCLLGFLIYFFTRPSAPLESDSTRPSQHTEESVNPAVPSGRISKQTLRHKEGDAAPVIEETDPKFRSFSHGPSDFAKGELQNIKLEGGTLQLGDNPAFTPRLKPYRFFGNYVSPEQSTPEQFEAIVANVETKLAGENELIFEFRTRTADEWSVWEEISPDEFKHAVTLESPATAWQYRITLFSNDPATAPKISEINISTRKSDAVSHDSSLAPQATPN